MTNNTYVPFASLKLGAYFFVHMNSLTLMYVKVAEGFAHLPGHKLNVRFSPDQLVDAR